MMEKKRALTIPFAVDKDRLIENPLRIPTSYLESGRLEQQVSWTAIAGLKSRHCDSQHINGSVWFDHNHAAIVNSGLDVRKPFLILTDVLKTEAGKAYMKKVNLRLNGKEEGHGNDHSVVSRNSRPSQVKTTNLKSNSVTPKSKQTSNSTSSHRSRSIRRTPTKDEEEDKTDIYKVVSGKNEKFEVVDCGLSVSWEPEDANRCKFSTAKETAKEPEKALQKRKINECAETGSPKRPRESVLRLSGLKNTDGEPTRETIGPGEDAEKKDLKNTDSGILHFTVGGDSNAELTTSFNTKAVSTPGSPKQKMSLDNSATRVEPIVLSSDDDEGGDEKIRGPRQISQKAVSPQKNVLQDVQMLQLLVNSDSVKDTSLCLAFSTLHCGQYQAKANGDILITEENIIIPLKDTGEEMDLMLTLERKELRRYGVWEQHELETLTYFCKGNDEPIPSAALFCCVSEAAAEGVQYDLNELCDKADRPKSSEKPSPFLLIFLQDPLEGVEVAYLRSLLDMDCLKSIAQQKSLVGYDQAIVGPTLSLEESFEVIKLSRLDPHLLRLLGQGSTSRDKDCTLLESLESSSYTEPETETQQTVLEPDKKLQFEKPSHLVEADQLKENLNLPPEKNIIAPVYTLCHRRLKDSYSVSMCKSDSSWVKYKRQGLAHRLIQFPPPPMKGGITVTMEDLQCLDSGQYLNDVIIDFYLKYLLQNASESVAGRAHIFSSFFYKQLTRRDNASEGSSNDSCQRQKRYQRVRTWTRHVDIFTKDFLFVPVNQEAHWYLVVICFPGLEEPKTAMWSSANMGKDQDEVERSKSSNDNLITKSDTTDTENSEKVSTKDSASGPVNCTEQTCQRQTVCKRPCILVMDSLKRSPHERIFKLLREYLQSEWEARRGSSRDFGPDQMQSSHCQVPLQDNSTDCGLYLLHYVESFLKDPMVHFDLPLQLKCWFPRHQVRRKRDEIRDLVLKLYRIQNIDSKR